MLYTTVISSFTSFLKFPGVYNAQSRKKHKHNIYIYTLNILESNVLQAIKMERWMNEVTIYGKFNTNMYDVVRFWPTKYNE